MLANYQYTYGPSGAAVLRAGPARRHPSAHRQIADLLFSETDNGVTTNYGYDARTS